MVPEKKENPALGEHLFHYNIIAEKTNTLLGNENETVVGVAGGGARLQL